MPPFSEKLDDFLVRNLAYFNYRNYARRIDLQGNEKVLEVGCGGGNLSRFLAKRVEELVCIDNSNYWIKKSEERLKKFKNIKFEISDILDFDKKNYLNYFDVVVVNYVLHDIASEKREKAAENLSKSIKDSGKICIREPTRQSHGIFSNELRNLMLKKGFSEKISNERYYFPLKGKIYEGIFYKTSAPKIKSNSTKPS